MDPSNNQEEIYMSNSQMYPGSNEGGSSSYQGGYPAGGSYPQHGMFTVHQQQQHNQINLSQHHQHFGGGARQQQMQPHQQQAHHHQPTGYSLIRYPSYTPAPNHPPTTYYIQQPQQQQQHYYQPQSNHHPQNQHYTNQMSAPSSNYSNHPNSECSMDLYNLAGQEEVVSLVEEYTMGSMDPQPAPITTSRPPPSNTR
uniref:Uncharacterized protein n=1 Tax=Ditylenchus dipsaci TaxID=166011 RepID=A0A915DZ46_9BILA